MGTPQPGYRFLHESSSTKVQTLLPHRSEQRLSYESAIWKGTDKGLSALMHRGESYESRPPGLNLKRRFGTNWRSEELHIRGQMRWATGAVSVTCMRPSRRWMVQDFGWDDEVAGGSFCSDDSRAQVVFLPDQWRLSPSPNSANCMKRPSTSPHQFAISPAPMPTSGMLASSFKTVAAAGIKPRRRGNHVLARLRLRIIHCRRQRKCSCFHALVWPLPPTT